MEKSKKIRSQKKLQGKLLHIIVLCSVVASLGILLEEVIYAKLKPETLRVLDLLYIILWGILVLENLSRLLHMKKKQDIQEYLKFNKAEIIYLLLSIVVVPLSLVQPLLYTARWIVLLKLPNALSRFNDENVFQVIANMVAVLMILFFVLPFLNVIAVSLSSPGQIINIFPKNINFFSLDYVIHDAKFLKSFINSIFITVVGTLISVLSMTMAAYPLSKPNMPLRKTVLIFFMIVMLFSGGIAPNILVVNALGLTDTIWALIFPSVVIVYYLLLIKGFFESIPLELEESAKLDGANNFVILFKIFIPMSAPMIVTVSFFTIIYYWNNINNSILYITSNQSIYPVPMYIKNFLSRDPMDIAQSMPQLLPYWDNIKMGYILVSIIPILCAYPLIFKYLKNDVSAGAVKG